jgi:hypothetical protein
MERPGKDRGEGRRIWREQAADIAECYENDMRTELMLKDYR